MTQIQINGSDTAMLHVFALDLPREAVERFATQAGTGEWPLQYALGATKLRPAFVEVIDLRDLAPLTLSQYLAQAHDATGTAFAAARAQLDALRGHVVVLPAPAFDGTSQTLTVGSPLRHVGSYGETRARQGGAKLRSAGARGSGGGGAAAQGLANARVLRIVLAALGLLIALALMIVLL